MKEYYILGEPSWVARREVRTTESSCLQYADTGFLKLEYNFRQTLFGKSKNDIIYIPVFLYTEDTKENIYYEFFTNEIFGSARDIKENTTNLPVNTYSSDSRYYRAGTISGRHTGMGPRKTDPDEFLQCVNDYLRLLKSKGIDEQKLKVLIKARFECMKNVREEAEEARKQKLLQAKAKEDEARRKLDEMSGI